MKHDDTEEVFISKSEIEILEKLSVIFDELDKDGVHTKKFFAAFAKTFANQLLKKCPYHSVYRSIGEFANKGSDGMAYATIQFLSFHAFGSTPILIQTICRYEKYRLVFIKELSNYIEEVANMYEIN